MSSRPALRATPTFSTRLDAALVVAALVHRDHVRKGTAVPYLMHPFHVALILDRHGYGEEVVIAGLLHDVLEDADFDDEGLQARLKASFVEADELPADARDGDAFRKAFVSFLTRLFGVDVLRLVEAVTEKKKDGGRGRAWLVRKQEQLAKLSRASADVAALKAADALHNVRSILGDLEAHGMRTMQRFTGTPEESARYYLAVAELVRTRLGDTHPLAREVSEAAAALRDTLTARLEEAASKLRALGGRGKT